MKKLFIHLLHKKLRKMPLSSFPRSTLVQLMIVMAVPIMSCILKGDSGTPVVARSTIPGHTHKAVVIGPHQGGRCPVHEGK